MENELNLKSFDNLSNCYRNASPKVKKALLERVLEKKEEWGKCFVRIGITGEGKRPNFQVRNYDGSLQVSYHGALGKEMLSGFGSANLTRSFASDEIFDFINDVHSESQSW